MNYRTFLLLIPLTYFKLNAQSAYLPLGSYSMHVLDRMEIKQGRLASPDEFNTSTKCYKRLSIARYADSFDINSASFSKQDYFNLEYLQNDNFEYSTSKNTLSKRKLFKTGLYKYKAALFDLNLGDFKLIVNPVTYQKFEYDNAQRQSHHLNVRGLEMRGQVGERISFYSTVSDAVQSLNSWNRDFFNKYQVIPGMSVLGTLDGINFNYYLNSAYINYQVNRYIDVQAGHGKNFLGNGYRSLMLSDFSPNHLFLRVNTHAWKINYTNIWGQVVDYQPISRALPVRHYYATTQINVNITKKLNVGLFQNIVFQRDSGYTSGGFDWQYANPIILYKPVENGLNSPDKAILGMDWKYNFLKHFSTYGQIAISEFKVSELFGSKGWWGNKTAVQLGLKYVDVFNIHNLDIQLEYNRVRPYMYTSFSTLNAYVNFNQSMAHPLGANFKESIGIIRYQPVNSVFITSKFLTATFGNDTNGSNWGSDIRQSYYTRVREYGNVIGQGVTTKLYIGDVTISYMFRHNMFIDIELIYRKTTSSLPMFASETFNAAIAFRWNINAVTCDF